MKIFVKVKPLSKMEKVEKKGDYFLVAVKAPPAKGLANKSVIKILADYFQVSPSRVGIVSGFTTKQKLIEIR